MSKTNTKTARNVIADMLADEPKKDKAPKTNAKATKAKAEAPKTNAKATKAKAKAEAPKRASAGSIKRFDPDSKIRLLKPYEARSNTNRAVLYGIVKKAKTVGEYKVAKTKAGYGNGVGNFFAHLVRDGFVRVA